MSSLSSRFDCVGCGRISTLGTYINKKTKEILGNRPHCVKCAEASLGRTLDERDWSPTAAEIRSGLAEALKLVDEAGWQDEYRRARLYGLLER